MNINKYLQFKNEEPDLLNILIDKCSRLFAFFIKLRAIKISMFYLRHKVKFSELNKL